MTPSIPFHVEFFDQEHFDHHYLRTKAAGPIAQYIDFFWETDFDGLWSTHTQGFADILFPNVGYTYLINLGTSYQMQLGKETFQINHDIFLPRYKAMICHHRFGNRIFGIKFKVSPVLFEKNVDFSEYMDYIFSLSYLIDPNILRQVKQAMSFAKRVEIVSGYYQVIIDRHAGSLRSVDTITEIMDYCLTNNEFNPNLNELANQYGMSARTLKRYFLKCTGLTSKQAMQIIRIRKVTEHLSRSPETFDFRDYGYFDYSHFFKNIKQFLNSLPINISQPHLVFLKSVRMAKK